MKCEKRIRTILPGVIIGSARLSFSQTRHAAVEPSPEALGPWIVLIAGFGLAIGAHFLLTKPDIIASIDPYYVLVVGVVLAWLGSQQQFTSLKERGLIVRPLKKPT